jgi:nicotinate phosphoribosyltransferase
MVKAVEPKACIEFGIRRAQGPDGALTASEFAWLGGFSGTSNINAAMKLDIKCYGTMSHAYVTSFENL